MVLRTPFFRRRCAVVLFLVLRTPDTSQFGYTGSFRALIFPGRSDFFPGRCGAVFSPEQSPQVSHSFKKAKFPGFEWMTNELFAEKKKNPVTLTGDLKFRRKINWFVTCTFCYVTAKNQKLLRALLQICKNCHGHLSFFTGIFLAFLSRVTSQFSRAKFGVFCHGHFFKITGIFSKSVTGKP